MADWNSYLAGILGPYTNPQSLLSSNPRMGLLAPAMQGGDPMQLDPSAMSMPQLPQQGATPAPSAQSNFWSNNNPDGTSSYLGGLFKYDPKQDIGSGDRLGLFGASLADAGANFGGHPADATNLARYTDAHKKLIGQQALAQLFNGAPASGMGSPLAGAPDPASMGARLADTSADPSRSWNANNPGPTSGPITVPPGSDHPDAAPAPNTTLPSAIPGGDPMQLSSGDLPRLPSADASTPAQQGGQPSQFNMRSMLPKLMQLQAQYPGADISPYVTMLKDMQPKYSPTVNYTKDGKGYLVGEDGSIDWLSPNVTPRDKMEIAGNGAAYDPYNIQPGADFSDRSKTFNSATGAGNVPVQRFEMGKVTAPAIIRANTEYARMNQESLQPPVTIGFTGQDGEEKQVAASFNRKTGKYVDASTGQVLTSTPNLRVIGNATGGGRSMAMAGRVATAALDASTDIENLSGIGTGAGMGLFANVQTTPLSALSRTLTPQEVQDTQTTMAGLSRAMSLLGSGGMQGSDSVMKSFDSLQPNTGDSMLTTMRKLGSFKQQAGNAIDAALASPLYSPDQKKQLNGAKARLESAVPWTPRDVQNLENNGQSGTSMREIYAKKLGKPLPPSPNSLPRLNAPAGTSGGVKWRIVTPGGQ